MNNIKSALLLGLSIVLISFSAVAASKLDIISPQDKTITWSIGAGIAGTAPGANDVTLNGTKIDLESGGNIEAAAQLRPGKNVIFFTASYPDGEELSKKIRVLRMVTCDDMEKSTAAKRHWARKQILNLLTLGIIEGYPDNLFLPGKPLERGEFATWLARAKQLKLSYLKEDVFFDVPKEHWRAPYIKAVADAGYMGAVSADSFGINEMIKRSDAVVAVAKANDLSPLKMSKSPFHDVPLNFKNADYIYAAYSKGWIIGVPGNIRNYEPERNMTRAEIAVLLSRLSSVKDQVEILNDFENGYTNDQFCAISTKPSIDNIAAEPAEIYADGKTPLNITAAVSDAQGPSDISLVWADLSEVGGPNNAKMDLTDSGSYEVSFVMPAGTEPGDKMITITALDKSGLKSEASTVKVLVKSPAPERQTQ